MNLSKNDEMAATRVILRPDLSPVFGVLDHESAERVHERLAAADALLAGIVEILNERGGVGFSSDGVLVEQEVSGQAMVRVLVENEKRSVGFAAELRPRNFFADAEHPWQPGRPPLVMATDAWDVDGAVSVRYKTRVAGRPFTIAEQLVELTEQRYDTAELAAEAFVAACEELAELALSREPSLPGWKPEIPASVGATPLA
jgi:hypothetical protein